MASYDGEGHKYELTSFVNGIEEGEIISYYKNGRPNAIGQMKNGKWEGMFDVYDEQGRYITSVEYRGGQMVKDLPPFG